MTVFLMSLGFGLQYGYQGTDNWFGFSYLGIYMGVSFMLIACAIVSIRELSNIANNKKRYDCLIKLGMDSSMIRSTLLKEEILYFGLPVIFSGIAIAIGLIGAKSNALQYLNADINKGIGIALAIAIGVYFTYFLFTYILSYKTITKEYRQND